jgi:hypothetical protein
VPLASSSVLTELETTECDQPLSDTTAKIVQVEETKIYHHPPAKSHEATWIRVSITGFINKENEVLEGHRYDT